MPSGRTPRGPALQPVPLRTATGKQLAAEVMNALRDVGMHVDYATLETRIEASLAAHEKVFRNADLNRVARKKRGI